jgi:AraC-like DNA-binding protein
LAEQEANSPYSSEIIRSSFQAVLWQVRRIYESIKTKRKINRASAVIASQFQFLVNKHFVSKTLVEDYADMLNITPNHLSQTIKAATGKPAKSVITQRRLDEAKFLLKYTSNEIAEISYHLNFAEPTHFTKFFKKDMQRTPLEYRRVNSSSIEL